MSSIPPFPLPSNQKKVIRFREPTVSDSIDFCELNESLEELSTTSYLNQLQDNSKNEIQNSALWTGQDRRTALWWIFIAISKDTELAYNYQCEHCGEEHVAIVDMVSLDDTASSLVGKPYIDTEVMIQGITKHVRFAPFDGRALEHMEERRLERDMLPKDSQEYKRMDATIRVLEVVHSFDFKEDDKMTWEDKLEKKLNIVIELPRLSEFKPLAEKAYLARNELDHGVVCEVKQGKMSLVSPPQICKKGGENSTVILMPFRLNDFIPEV